MQADITRGWDAVTRCTPHFARLQNFVNSMHGQSHSYWTHYYQSDALHKHLHLITTRSRYYNEVLMSITKFNFIVAFECLIVLYLRVLLTLQGSVTIIDGCFSIYVISIFCEQFFFRNSRR